MPCQRARAIPIGGSGRRLSSRLVTSAGCSARVHAALLPPPAGSAFANGPGRRTTRRYSRSSPATCMRTARPRRRTSPASWPPPALRRRAVRHAGRRAGARRAGRRARLDRGRRHRNAAPPAPRPVAAALLRRLPRRGPARDRLYPGPAAARALTPSGQAGNYPVLLVDGVVGGLRHQRRSAAGSPSPSSRCAS